MRTVTLRPVAVFAKAFTPRRVGSLLAIAVARRVRLFVAEFPVRETRGRAGVAAVEIGPIATRLERALFAVATTRRTIAEWPVAARAVIPVETRRTIAKWAIA